MCSYWKFKYIIIKEMTFQLPRVNTCCCGCSLKIGVYIIAVINLACFLALASLNLKFTLKRMIHGGYTDVEFLQTDLFNILLFSQITFSLYLLYAVYKVNSSYMMPYLLLQSCTFILMIVIFLFEIMLHTYGKYHLDALLPVVIGGLEYYSIIVISSHYRNLKEGQMIPT